MRESTLLIVTIATFLTVCISLAFAAENDKVKELLLAPKSIQQECESGVETFLDDNPNHTFTLVENRHNPWVTDRRHTYQSGPITIVVLEATDVSKCLLEQVDITGHQDLIPLAVSPSDPRDSVINILGEPDYAYPSVDIYVVSNDIGSDRITIRYEMGHVNSITWKYFVD